MKVLVTGGAGFIGSNLVHLLIRERPQWNLHVLDALTYAGNIENIHELIDSGSVAFHKVDITDRAALEKLFKAEKFDMVFHLAAESHVDRSIHGALPFVMTNVIGTQNLLDLSMQNKVERFVNISTDEVYGSLADTGLFYETTPLDPSSPYSASKAGSDMLVLAAHKTHGYNVVMTRCTNNYGPYQFPEKLIPLFITNALEDKKLPLYGDGLNIRSWIHVQDHNEALLAVAEKGRPGEVYNIGPDSTGEITNKEMTARILSLLGKGEDLIQRVADRLGHDRRYAVSIEKIQKELGWSPKINIETGLKQTVAWYLENKDWWARVKAGSYKDFYETNYAKRFKKTA